MKGDPLYAEEKFSVALHTMATGQGILKDRLLSAFLSFHIVGEEDLPEYLQADHEWIIESLTSKPAKGKEGRVAATLAEMGDSTAEEIACRIYEPTTKLHHHNHDCSYEQALDRLTPGPG